MIMAKKMVEEKSWEEFFQTGLLLIINQILHVFGWSIVRLMDSEQKKVLKVYPARVKFRGFSSNVVDGSYQKITQYMNEQSASLLDDFTEDKEV